MQDSGYLKIVSIALAEQSRRDELESSRALIRQWPDIEKLTDKTERIIAAMEFENRVREHLTRFPTV